MPRSEQIKNYLKVTPKDPFPGGGRFALLIDERECDQRVRAELVELEPDECFPLHIHPKSDHIIIVVSGEGQLLWRGAERQIVAGDTFVVPLGDTHSIGAGSRGPLRFVVLNVPPIDFHHPDFMHPVEADSRIAE
jgi:quercetin dioxygenase-like cupin family protein